MSSSAWKNFFYKTSLNPQTNQPIQKPDLMRITGAACMVIIILSLIIVGSISLIKAFQSPPQPTIPTTNPTDTINAEKQKAAEAASTSAAANTPQGKLLNAYNDIVGSPDFLKEITFNNGNGVISYTINSKDTKTILTTGYQNFADFANRVFNIQELNDFRLVVYATGIVDSQGQTATPAMTLEISRAKNNNVDWNVNKFRYSTYQQNLDVNQINPLLTKDYNNLIKTS